MSVAAATNMFKAFAKRAFSRRRGATLPLIGRIIQLKYQSQYHTQGLETSLRESLGTEFLFGGPRTTQSASRCKVAVTTTDTSREARLLANYNRSSQPNTPYIFQRFDKLAQEMKVWEAGRATSAAPGYFKGFYLPSNGHTYWDGALKFNNPILAADLERQHIWPESKNQLPDIMLSLGTGFFPDCRTQSGEAGPRFGIGIIDGVKALVHMGMDAIESGLNCEKTWNEFFSCSFPESPEREERLLRLSLRVSGSKIQLDDVDKMARLEELTRQQYGPRGPDHYRIAQIAAKLVASLFYFDLEAKRGERITGMGSTEMFVGRCPNCDSRVHQMPTLSGPNL